MNFSSSFFEMLESLQDTLSPSMEPRVIYNMGSSRFWEIKQSPYRAFIVPPDTKARSCLHQSLHMRLYPSLEEVIGTLDGPCKTWPQSRGPSPR